MRTKTMSRSAVVSGDARRQRVSFYRFSTVGTGPPSNNFRADLTVQAEQEPQGCARHPTRTESRPVTRLRRLCASLVIFGALAPSGAAVAVAVHELLEHESFAVTDAVTLAALFHGHRHPDGAPDHDHTLVKPSSTARIGDVRLPLHSGSPSDTLVPAPKLAAASFALHRPALSTGSGPPPGISPLRV